MKNTTTLLILLSLFIISCGDKTIDSKSLVERDGIKYKVNEQTPFSGKWTWYHENGWIFIEENYKDGKKDGKGIWYYPNGKIMSDGNYKDGKKDGKETFYYLDGSIDREENYKDGKLINNY